MSHWYLKQKGAGGIKTVDLCRLGDAVYSIDETSFVSFEIHMTAEERACLGTPCLFIGSRQLPLASQSAKDGYIYHTPAADSGHEALLLLNYFGRCEVLLSFPHSPQDDESAQFDVRARKSNARLATEMLGFIANNVDDMVSLCFARQQHENYSKLSLLKKIFSFLYDQQVTFIRKHPFSWHEELRINDQGLPAGSDSVSWVLDHLDQLAPTALSEANVCINNRGFRIDSLPDEVLTEDTDVYENQVLHTFLAATHNFLTDLRSKYLASPVVSVEDSFNAVPDNGYVSFSQTLQSYQGSMISHQLKELDELVLQAEHLQQLFSNIIPAKAIPGLQPKVTSYVIKNAHYRTTFNDIAAWYLTPEPPIEGLYLLMGMKNLSAIYEQASLLMLIRVIREEFNADAVETSYHQQSEHLSFGGQSQPRPKGEVNNYFRLRNDDYVFEVFYEPHIYTYDPSLSKPGDLIDISDLPSGKNKRHHFSPDFVLRIKSHLWQEPLVVILDAKYTHAKRIREHSLTYLTQRYLMGIHQLKDNGYLGISPVKLLIVLFAHAHQGDQVSHLARKHWVTGELPVLPQATGLLFAPGKEQAVRECFKKVVEVYHSQQLKD